MSIALTAGAAARELTDMAGRRVTVPDVIRRVYGASPPATYLAYVIDPTLLVGLNYPLREEERAMLCPEFTQQPVVGGLFGQGRTVNMEVLLTLHPDVVLYWAWQEAGINAKLTEPLARAGIATVALKLDRLSDYPEALLFLGEVLHRQERAAALEAYGRDALQSVAAATATVPENERVSVYYAEGPDGLATERDTSVHTELISLAGGRNVHRGAALNSYGMEKVSLEQVLVWDPQAVVVQEPTFCAAILNDPRWSSLRAVRGKRVYCIPRQPFNWFDRPPSVMRFLGLKWLAHALYPARYPLDLTRETQTFYRLFLGVELTARGVREIVRQ